MTSKSLLAKITEYFPKRKESCLRNIILLVQVILLKETINLNKLKGCLNTVQGKTNVPSSNYKRLIRIFDNYARTNLWIELLQFGFQVLRLKTEYLIIDGTKWQRGDKWYHYQVLSIVYQGVAIPLYWENINKKGISNCEERKRIFSKALKYFHLEGKTLLGDREYIGSDWFKYLINKGIDFTIRSKKNTYVDAVNQADGRTYQQMIDKVLRSKLSDKAVGKIIELEGQKLHFVVIKNPKNDPDNPVIFLLSTHLDKFARAIGLSYCLRYKIEHCFKHLKSNGFCLQQLNLRTMTRCRLLMAITVFAYVLSINEGLKDYKKIKMNASQNKEEKRVSVFRNGIDKVVAFCFGLERFCLYLIDVFLGRIPKYRNQILVNV